MADMTKHMADLLIYEGAGFCVRNRQTSAGRVSRLELDPANGLNRLPLRILFSGLDLKQPAYHPGDKRMFEFYSLCWFKGGGKGVFWSEATGEISIAPGCMILICPGQWNWYMVRSGYFHESYLTFTGSWADQMRRAGIIDAGRPIVAPSEPERIELAIALARQMMPESHLRAALIVESLLINAHYEIGGERREHQRNLAALLGWIYENPQRHLRNAEMAKRLNVSVSGLCRLFLSATGKSPVAYGKHVRMQKACRLLLETDQPVKAIAAALGYVDQLYFSKRFNKAMGMSPRAYRKQWGRITGRSIAMISSARPDRS